MAKRKVLLNLFNIKDQLLANPDAIDNIERNLTIKDILLNLTDKYIKTKEFSCMTPNALSNPITNKMLNTSMQSSNPYKSSYNTSR